MSCTENVSQVDVQVDDEELNEFLIEEDQKVLYNPFMGGEADFSLPFSRADAGEAVLEIKPNPSLSIDYCVTNRDLVTLIKKRKKISAISTQL